MKIALLQTDIIWETPKLNYINIYNQINDITDIDLLVLPEMFSTGFSMKSSKISEKTLGETFTWMKNLAKQKNFSIVGSIATKKNNNYYNRLYYIESSGDYKFYDKRHLFRMAKEHHF